VEVCCFVVNNNMDLLFHNLLTFKVGWTLRDFYKDLFLLFTFGVLFTELYLSLQAIVNIIIK
jgi:hypothetical protein